VLADPQQPVQPAPGGAAGVPGDQGLGLVEGGGDGGAGGLVGGAGDGEPAAQQRGEGDPGPLVPAECPSASTFPTMARVSASTLPVSVRSCCSSAADWS
jgi:hypothetical protein